MEEKSNKGKMLCTAMAAYFVAKAALNMILGGFSIGGLLIAIGLGAMLFTGMQFVNIAVSAVLAVTVLMHISYNISNLPGTLVYLAEAVLDIGCIVLLLMNRDVRAQFRNKWQDMIK